jgi:NADH dehydrogenase
MRIIIAGAGFAGLAAEHYLKAIDASYEIILFDKNSYSTMLPSLPDFAGGKLTGDMLQGEIKNIISKKTRFKQESIKQIDLNNKTVVTQKDTYHYDYLIIAGGSVTNFFNFSKNLNKIFKLDSYKEAIKIRESFTNYIKTNQELNLVLSGAGYTGLELAACLNYLASTADKKINISIVEMADNILPFLSASEKTYISKFIAKNNFEIITGSAITDFDGKNVTINNNRIINNSFLIWTAGSKASIDNIAGDFEKLNDGRIVVNKYLRIPNYPDVFAAGDAAAINSKGIFLRKAVNFSVRSGKHAGKNLLRHIKNKESIEFRPVDLGWIIPLHDASLGRLLNKIPLKGNLGLRLHYFMAGFRNYSIKNFLKYCIVALKQH